MPFRVDDYDEAFSRFVRKSIEALAIARSPLLSQIETIETTGTVGSRVRDRSGMDVSLEPSTTVTEFASDFKAVQGGDYVQLQVSIDKASDSLAEQLVGMLVETMRKVTDGTGNVVDAAGRPLSFEVIYEMLDTMEYSLDENGQLVLPSMLMSPTQAKKLEQLPQLTEEQEQKLEALKARKREEALARRRSRRLS